MAADAGIHPPIKNPGARDTGAEKAELLPLLAVAEEAQEVEKVRVASLRWLSPGPLLRAHSITRIVPEKTT